MNKKIKPTKHNTRTLHQLCNLIPTGMVRSLAKEYGVDKVARDFCPWSHVVSLLFAQLTHSIGLNDVCDTLRNHSANFSAIRGAKAPARNTLSHANMHRNSDMAEALFWKMLEHLTQLNEGFGRHGRYRKLPSRFKRGIHAVDSSTISLVARCMDWAKHRSKKAAAKLHLRLNLQTFLPAFAIVEEASHHDDTRVVELCADLEDGEIAIFDKAYVNFKHLYSLSQRGVYWVTRAKDNMRYGVRKKLIRKPQGKILKDEIICLSLVKSKKQYPENLRRVEALVEVDGKEMVMVFITNNLDWSANTICELYQARWAIEVFFKQLKQTLQVSTFLGYTKNAIRWQIWIALLLYLLMRFLSFASSWNHSFTRLVTVIRGVIWSRFNILDLLKSYGIAGGQYRMCATPQDAYLPGFSP
jgi:hypothetical protein